MIGVLLGAALAHPVGRHVVPHTLTLDVGPTLLSVRYRTVVPPEIAQDTPPDTLTRELAAGLVLTASGETLPSTITTTYTAPDPHGLTVDLTLTAELPTTDVLLIVSNGNLPETRSVFRSAATVAPRHRVIEDTLWPQGTADPAARRASIRISSPTNPAERLHRAVQNGPFAQPRSAYEARQTSPWTTNQSRPWMLAAPLLGVLGARRRRPTGRHQASIAVGLMLLVTDSPVFESTPELRARFLDADEPLEPASP